jgi:polyisoprenoid-binding protein YceI
VTEIITTPPLALSLDRQVQTPADTQLAYGAIRPQNEVFVLWFALSFACAPDLSKDRAVAEVNVAEPTPDAAPANQPSTSGLPVPALQAATVLPIDPARSSLAALGAKITSTEPVEVHVFDGRVGLEGERVTGVAFAADVSSIESTKERLTEHLKKEDFLWVEKYPHATFVSTDVKEGSTTPEFSHTVTGNLTIRGKTKQVSFPANIAVSPAEVTAKSEFVVNRQDFDIRYPGKPDDLVQDNVVLKIAFVAPRT